MDCPQLTERPTRASKQSRHLTPLFLAPYALHLTFQTPSTNPLQTNCPSILPHLNAELHADPLSIRSVSCNTPKNIVHLVPAKIRSPAGTMSRSPLASLKRCQQVRKHEIKASNANPRCKIKQILDITPYPAICPTSVCKFSPTVLRTWLQKAWLETCRLFFSKLHVPEKLDVTTG